MGTFACDACENVNSLILATAYCIDCSEYLCTVCIAHHRKLNLTRHHQICDNASMPVRRTHPKGSPHDTEKCQDHDHEYMNYFCKSCDKIGCARCMLICCDGSRDIALIPHIVNDHEYTIELKEVTNKLAQLSQELINTKIMIERHSEALNVFGSTAKLNYSKMKDDTIKIMKEKRNEIDKLCDEIMDKLIKIFTVFEEKANEEKDKLKNEDEQVMMSLSYSHTDLMKNVQTFVTDLTNKQTSGKLCQVFTFVKQSKNDIQRLNRNLQLINEKNMIHKVEIEPAQAVFDIINGAKNFAQLLNEIFESFKETTAKQIEDISSKPSSDFISVKVSSVIISELNAASTGQDKKLCFITGSTLINGIYFISVDYSNCSVKAIDTKKNKVVSVHELPGQPWDITTVKSNKVAITIPYLQKIQFLTVSDSGSITYDSEISLHGYCHGIIFSKEYLIVSFKQPGRVQIFKKNGTFLTPISDSLLNKHLFSSPEYMAVSPDLSTIYVSDWYTNTVTSMTLTQQVKAIYIDDNLQQPRGLAVDMAGFVYVCGYSSHNIIQLSADLSKGHVWLNTNDQDFPYSITLSKDGNEMYVAMDNSNQIKVYKSMNQCCNKG